MTQHIRVRAWRLALLAPLPAALAACGPMSIGYEAELGDVGNLVDSSPEAVAASREQARNGAAASEMRTVDAEEAAEGVGDVRVLVGPPSIGAGEASGADRPANPLAASDDAYGNPTRAAAPARDVEPVLIDALVGQINGRPVFASEFFEPLDARLRAEAKRLSADAWLRQSREEIKRELRGRIIDELLLAEFEASFPAEQRQGLLMFVRQIRQQLVTENRGSAALAEKRFEEQGSSLEEEVKRIRDREFINQQLRQEVASRIYVSWREVQAEFERNREKWDPPGTARLRMIWIDEAEVERIEQAQERLASGEAFEAVARDLSGFKASEGGLVEITLDAADYADSTLFGAEGLNGPAQSLSPGEHTEPFDWNGRRVWILLEEVNDPDPTLFDLQVEIYEDLWNGRFMEENARYLESLINKGTMTDIETMERRLFEIAADRYLIAGGASAARE